ncbi:MAG: hypothetical protein HAW67_05670 [Endozoicomonadaceae bacterium]|nr:hypothetical protein [Endozoicomonadaceae bacterium]
MAIRNRMDFKNAILQRLGAPINRIEITDTQLDMRIDEAIEYYRKYVTDGRYEYYHSLHLHATEISYYSNNDGQDELAHFTNKRTVQVRNPATDDDTPRTVRSYTSITSDGRLSQKGFLITIGMSAGPNNENLFNIGDELFFPESDDEAPLGVITDIRFGPMDLRYFELPLDITDVTSISHSAEASSSQSVFDLQYQLRLHDLYDLTSASVVYFNTVMNHLSLLRWLFNPQPQINFNYREGKLYVYADWESEFKLGEYIIAKGYRMSINNKTEEPILGYDRDGRFIYKSRMRSKLNPNEEIPIYDDDGNYINTLTYENVMDIGTFKEEVYRQLDNGEITKGTIYVNKSKTAKYMQFTDDGVRLTADNPEAVKIDEPSPLTDLKEIQKPIHQDDNARAWDDYDLINLATGYVKKQWGINLSKYEDVNLMGGFRLDGTKKQDEAIYEIEKFEKIILARQRPLHMDIG